MITINARITLLEGNNEDFEVGEVNTTKNNRSAEITAIKGSKPCGSNPFMLGVTCLNSNSTLSNGVDYFISRAKANENGELVYNGETSYDLHIDVTYENSTYADRIVIIFDTYNNQYPTQIFVEGKAYQNKSPIFIAKGLDKNILTKQIGFDVWNKPNYPVRIEGIGTEIKIDVDKRNMLSYNGIVQIKAEQDLPNFGIISTTGNLSFVDKTGEIEKFAINDLLKENLNVGVFIKNTINKKSQKINDFETDTWNYDNNSREVNVSLRDDLAELQNINFEGINYVPNISPKLNGAEIYNILYEKTPKKYKMLSLEELGWTKTYLEQIIIDYPFLNSSSLWSAWQKFCEAFQLYIYKNKSGKTACIAGVEI